MRRSRVRRGSPFLGRDSDEIERENRRPGKELISRREVADLGNVRSRLVRQLVEWLKQGAGGYEWYCRMGLVHEPPDRDAWLTASVASLVANLRPWSVKQVRTHFDRLHRDGLITAEREHENGPWRYELPEEFSDSLNPFHDLPPVTQLRPPESGETESMA